MKSTANTRKGMMSMKRLSFVIGLAVFVLFSAACATTNGASAVRNDKKANSTKKLSATLTPDGNMVMLEIKGNISKEAIKVRRLYDPDRVVIDIEGLVEKSSLKGLKADGKLISSVDADVYTLEGRTITRIEMKSNMPLRFSTVVNDNDALLSFVPDAALASLLGSDDAKANTEEKDQTQESQQPAQAQANANGEEATTQDAPTAETVAEDNYIPPQPVPANITLKAVKVVSSKAGSKIVFLSNKKIDSALKSILAFGLMNPNRLVFDFYGAKASKKLRAMKRNSGAIEGVRIGRHSDRVRVVLDLREGTPLMYSYKVSGKKLVVTVGSGVAARIGDPEFLKDEPANTALASNDTKAEADAEPANDEATEQAEAAPSIAHLSAISFAQGDTDIAIRMKFNGNVNDWKVVEAKDGMLVLDIDGVVVPEKMQQSIDTSDFNCPVKSVSVYEADPANNKARVVINAETKLNGKVERNGNELVWRFDYPEGSKNAYKGAVTLNMDGQLAIDYSVEESKEQAASSDKTAAIENTNIEIENPEAVIERKKLQQRRTKKRYTGEKISLELKDADIRDVLRLIADVSKINIVAADDVRGSVTVRLINVPWDLALDVILKTKGYGMVQKGRIIRIAPQKVLDAEMDAKFKAEMVKLYTRPLQVFLIPVNYSQAKGLVDIVKKVLSPRGEVTFDSRTNMLIVKDILTYGQKAERLVASLDLQTPQVVIESRIVEAEIRNERGFGIQWGFNGLMSPLNGNPTGLVFPYTMGVAGGAEPASQFVPGTGFTNMPNWVVNVPVNNPVSGIGFTFGSVGNAFNLDLRLSALESEGKIKIVSSPKVATMDNTEAKIRQGLILPAIIEFTTIDPGTGAARLTTSMREIKTGIELAVTPHITSDGSIIMKIKIEKRDPDFSRAVRGIPTILEKKAETEILVKSGETVVIGGIYSNRTNSQKRGLPFLMNIPFIGWLFKGYYYEQVKSELLIFLTPRIVVSDEESATSAGL